MTNSQAGTVLSGGFVFVYFWEMGRKSEQS
ncbi:hypothetical protein Pan97_20300 [Bremerella volcania]|uniref:Uncharacterized protein n=1 Tax=Bremerella volcania TaxID=2527984 RepID=A0A518C712_9BACT|nr:hypothetical protein Pan97_20300 [Bremerella volcania]